MQSLQDASERYVRQCHAASDEVERLRTEVRGVLKEDKELRRRAEQMTHAKKDENNVVELQRELTFKQNTVKQLKAQLETHKQRAKWRGAEYAPLRRSSLHCTRSKRRLNTPTLRSVRQIQRRTTSQHASNMQCRVPQEDARRQATKTKRAERRGGEQCRHEHGCTLAAACREATGGENQKGAKYHKVA